MLIVVLVVVLFVLVIILILFRDSFQVFCCCKSLDFSEVDITHGLRNPAFDDQEYIGRAGVLPEQRPFSVMEAMESPPSYDEAVKQELFRFSLPPQSQRGRSNSIADIPVSPQMSSPPEFSEISASALSSSPPERETGGNSPSTSHQGASRKRSSTTGSNGMLSTISEEDSELRDERPLRMIIGNIGVQASRLLENCETSVNIGDGQELDKQSKC